MNHAAICIKRIKNNKKARRLEAKPSSIGRRLSIFPARHNNNVTRAHRNASANASRKDEEEYNTRDTYFLGAGSKL